MPDIVEHDAAVAFTAMMLNSDVEAILPLVQAPTLVLCRRGQQDGTAALVSGYMAANIPSAEFVELDGNDALPWSGDAVGEEIVAFLTGHRALPESDRVLATVVFTDIVQSTDLASALGDRQWRAILDRYEVLVNELVDVFRGRVVKSTGDGTLAVFDGPARAIRFASAVQHAVSDLDLELRCGVHTGEIELRGEDIGGIAVHISARVQSHAQPGEVLVSRTVVDLVAGSAIEFADRGEYELKGVAGPWRLFAVAHS